MHSPIVAIYGLGNMGFPIAERISRRFSVQVADLDQSRIEGAQRTFNAQPIRATEALAHTGVVVLSLPSPKASYEILRQIAPALPKDCVVVETSTVNPEDIHRCRALLAPHGLEIVDASVMAGVSQMQAGTASLAIGGSREAIAAAQTVLDCIAEKQIHFGDSGAGAAAKVINNAVAHAVMVVVAEAGAMATAVGIDPHKLIALLSDKNMGLHRPLTYRYAERIVQGAYDGGMPLDAALKDSVLALQLAQTLGVPLFAIQGSHAVYEMAACAGYGRDDYAAVAKLWADWGKPTVPMTSA